MTTLIELLLKADQGSGLLAPTILETVDTWLSWWERDALEHLKWAQSRHMNTDAAMGRLHQIQEIRRGLTDKQSIDTPEASRKTNRMQKP